MWRSAFLSQIAASGEPSALAAHASKNSSTTGEPAYRMLQILARLRGGHFQL